jgi:hypothetical protein
LPARALHIRPVENSFEKPRCRIVTGSDPIRRRSSILPTRGLEAAVFVFRSYL